MSTISISNQSQLDAALSKTVAGDVLVVAAGDYSLTLSNKNFSTPITIVSANSSSPARFGNVKLTDVSGVTLKGLDIGRSLGSGNAEATWMATITRGTNITLDGNHFHGSMDGDPRNDGIGLKFSASSNIKVINNEFEQLGRGGQFFGVTNLTVSNNDVHDIRSDGFDFSTIIGGVISGNKFTNFRRNSADHPDAIQFQTAGASQGSSNLTISNNVMLTGSGDGFQGIFLRDETGSLPYQNVTIENNFVMG